jgi:hypothetical protein
MAETSGLAVATREDGRLQLSLPKGCGCFFVIGDIVSGDWSLRPEVKEPLVKAVQYAGTRTKRFRFSATWQGDPAPQVEEVSLEELVVGIRGSRVSGRSLYQVQAA